MLKVLKKFSSSGGSSRAEDVSHSAFDDAVSLQNLPAISASSAGDSLVPFYNSTVAKEERLTGLLQQLSTHLRKSLDLVAEIEDCTDPSDVRRRKLGACQADGHALVTCFLQQANEAVQRELQQQSKIKQLLKIREDAEREYGKSKKELEAMKRKKEKEAVAGSQQQQQGGAGAGSPAQPHLPAGAAAFSSSTSSGASSSSAESSRGAAHAAQPASGDTPASAAAPRHPTTEAVEASAMTTPRKMLGPYKPSQLMQAQQQQQQQGEGTQGGTSASSSSIADADHAAAGAVSSSAPVPSTPSSFSASSSSSSSATPAAPATPAADGTKQAAVMSALCQAQTGVQAANAALSGALWEYLQSKRQQQGHFRAFLAQGLGQWSELLKEAAEVGAEVDADTVKESSLGQGNSASASAGEVEGTASTVDDTSAHSSGSVSNSSDSASTTAAGPAPAALAHPSTAAPPSHGQVPSHLIFHFERPSQKAVRAGPFKPPSIPPAGTVAAAAGAIEGGATSSPPVSASSADSTQQQAAGDGRKRTTSLSQALSAAEMSAAVASAAASATSSISNVRSSWSTKLGFSWRGSSSSSSSTAPSASSKQTAESEGGKTDNTNSNSTSNSSSSSTSSSSKKKGTGGSTDLSSGLPDVYAVLDTLQEEGSGSNEKGTENKLHQPSTTSSATTTSSSTATAVVSSPSVHREPDIPASILLSLFSSPAWALQSADFLSARDLRCLASSCRLTHNTITSQALLWTASCVRSLSSTATMSGEAVVTVAKVAEKQAKRRQSLSDRRCSLAATLTPASSLRRQSVVPGATAASTSSALALAAGEGSSSSCSPSLSSSSSSLPPPPLATLLPASLLSSGPEDVHPFQSHTAQLAIFKGNARRRLQLWRRALGFPPLQFPGKETEKETEKDAAAAAAADKGYSAVPSLFSASAAPHDSSSGSPLANSSSSSSSSTTGVGSSPSTGSSSVPSWSYWVSKESANPFSDGFLDSAGQWRSGGPAEQAATEVDEAGMLALLALAKAESAAGAKQEGVRVAAGTSSGSGSGSNTGRAPLSRAPSFSPSSPSSSSSSSSFISSKKSALVAFLRKKKQEEVDADAASASGSPISRASSDAANSEDGVCRWTSLIQQDVNRSYSLLCPFGQSPALLRWKDTQKRRKRQELRERLREERKKARAEARAEAAAAAAALRQDQGVEEEGAGAAPEQQQQQQQQQEGDEEEEDKELAALSEEEESEEEPSSPALEAHIASRKRELEQILLAAAAAEPAIRYSQGMSSLARLCLELCHAAAGDGAAGTGQSPSSSAPASAGDVSLSLSAAAARGLPLLSWPVVQAFNIFLALLRLGEEAALMSSTASAAAAVTAPSASAVIGGSASWSSAGSSSGGVASGPGGGKGDAGSKGLEHPPTSLLASILSPASAASSPAAHSASSSHSSPCHSPAIILNSLPNKAGTSLRCLFAPDTRNLRMRLYQIDRLLDKHEPELAKHLQSLQLSAPLFASSWPLTLFCNFSTLQLGQVTAVMDAFLLLGWEAVYAAGLCVMRLLRPQLMACSSMEDAFGILNAPVVSLVQLLGEEGIGGGSLTRPEDGAVPPSASPSPSSGSSPSPSISRTRFVELLLTQLKELRLLPEAGEGGTSSAVAGNDVLQGLEEDYAAAEIAGLLQL